MASWGTTYSRCYVCRGEGDIAAATAIQAQLREHGVSSYFNWDPRPPRWRFFYETDLTEADIEHVLGTMIVRFRITLEG